jgi:hypothetical protein
VPTTGPCRWGRPRLAARWCRWRGKRLGSPGPRLPRGPRRLVVGSPSGGPDTDRSWGAIRFPPHLQVSPESPTYTPRVDASPGRPTPTVSPVTPTPIYDQLRGERINAEVPATRADPHRLDHPDGHRLAPTVPTAPAVAFSRSPLAGTDRATSWSWFTATTPAAQPAINPTAPAEPGRETPPHKRTHSTSQPTGRDQETSVTWGPRAVPPPAVHARHQRAQPASGPPEPGAGQHPAAPGAAAAGHEVGRGAGQGPRQTDRTESRSAASVGSQQ